MTQSQTSFPSLQSLCAWAHVQKVQIGRLPNGKGKSRIVPYVQVGDLFYYFTVKSGHYDLAMTSLNDVFKENKK